MSNNSRTIGYNGFEGLHNAISGDSVAMALRLSHVVTIVPTQSKVISPKGGVTAMTKLRKWLDVKAVMSVLLLIIALTTIVYHSIDSSAFSTPGVISVVVFSAVSALVFLTDKNKKSKV
jgi:hypothetical protein